MYLDRIKEIVSNSLDVKTALLSNTALLSKIDETVSLIVHAFENNHKLLLCGNGGSAADAQHIAAEFTGRFYLNRAALFAEALHTNGSYMTAVANDYGFEKVYSRQLDAKGNEGDVLIAISTSGNSPNILEAINTAKSKGMSVILLTGLNGGKGTYLVDTSINVPSDDTPRIQECHILIGHIICELVEKELFTR